MMRYIVILISLFSLVAPFSANAQIYQGSGYTIDLLGKNWEFTPADSDSVETYSLASRFVQVFPQDQDTYSVMVSGNKKDISAVFQQYKKSIGSTDMKKEQSRMTKYGMIYFAVFSSYDTDPQDKFYGAFCIVSDRNSKSSRMVNILDLSRAIKPTEAIKICSSIKSVSTQTNTLNL